jgi:hypothetical protein
MHRQGHFRCNGRRIVAAVITTLHCLIDISADVSVTVPQSFTYLPPLEIGDTRWNARVTAIALLSCVWPEATHN